MISGLIVALLMFTFCVAGDELPPFQHLEGQKEIWKLYSRGNNDFEEFDEAGSTNFETAQIRTTLLTGKNEIGSISVWILYHANLSTDNFTSIYKPSYKLVKKIGEGDQALEEEVTLRVRVGPGGRPIDSSLSGEVLVQGLELTGSEQTYKGKVTVEFIPVGLLNNRVIREPIETINWEVTVKDNEVSDLKIDVAEADQESKRPGKEVLKLVRTSTSPKVSEGFPTRVGKIHRVERTSKTIGGESK